MNKSRIIQIAAAGYTATLAVIILFYTDFSSTYAAMLITFALVIAVYLVYITIRKKTITVREDELSRMVYLKGIRNSWLSVYCTISVVSLLHFFKAVHFTMEMLVFWQLLCMNITFFISLAWYNRHPGAL